VNNIMIDIETMGTSPTAAILSIGAVRFDADTMEPEYFYRRATLQSNFDESMTVDASTINFWLSQPEPARIELVTTSAEETLRVALVALYEFISPFSTTHPTPQVWANSPAFDCVILRNAYTKLGLVTPWTHRQERCYRTLKSLYPATKIEDVGVAHHALSDAMYQAKFVQATGALRNL
jgi:DNA polymerase III epsilon subunit-like protein